jgi:hypothetical protein
MPYFRCPNCSQLVHLVSEDSTEVACSRCRGQLKEELKLPPREQLTGLIGSPAHNPRPSSQS